MNKIIFFLSILCSVSAFETIFTAYHSDNVHGVALFEDSGIVASGSNDDTVKIWEFGTGQETQELSGATGHTHNVYTVDFSPDGNLLASGSADRKVKIWNTGNWNLEETITFPNYVYGLKFNHAGTKLAVVGYFASLRIFDVNDWGQSTYSLSNGEQKCWDVDYSPSDDKIVLGCYNGKITVLESNGDFLWNADLGDFYVGAVEFSPDGSKFLAGGNQQVLKIYDSDSYGELLSKNLGAQIKSATFHPNGWIVATGLINGKVILTNVGNGDEIMEISENTGTESLGEVYCLKFSMDGNRIILGTNNDFVKMIQICEENESIQDTGSCQTCHYSCQSCLGTNEDDCQTCNSQQNRIESPDEGRCDCLIGYFDNEEICQQCHYSCETCQNSPNEDNCETCNSQQNRILEISQCPCQDGYFDSGFPDCSQCHQMCKTCSGGDFNQCQSCFDENNFVMSGYLPGFCECAEGFQLENQECKKCHYSCLNCHGIQNDQCLMCSEQDFRILENNYCVCQDYFYEKNQKCEQCHHSCKRCEGPSKFQCLECGGLPKFRIDQPENGVCWCITNYIDVDQRRCVELFENKIEAEFFSENQENYLLFIQFSDEVERLDSQELQQNLKFYIDEFENVDLNYSINSEFKSNRNRLIECEIFSDKHLFLESNVNVKFTNIVPFGKNGKQLQYDLQVNGLNTTLQPYNENMQQNHINSQTQEKITIASAITLGVFQVISGSNIGAFITLLEIAQFLNVLVYSNIFLPMNLESFLKALWITNLQNYIPNIGQKNQYRDFGNGNNQEEVYFGIRIEDQKSQQRFETRGGFTASIWINGIAIWLLILLLWLIMFSSKYYVQYTKKKETHQKTSNSKVFQIISKIREKMEFKVILSVYQGVQIPLVLAVFIQLQNYSNANFLNQLGYFFSVLILIYILYYYIWFGFKLKEYKNCYNSEEYKQKFSTLIEYNINPQNPKFFNLHYHHLYMIKMDIIVSFLVLLYEYPKFQVAYMIAIIFIWIILAVCFKPFKTKLQNILFIASDVLIIVLFSIFACIRYNYQQIEENRGNFQLQEKYFNKIQIFGNWGIVVVISILCLHIIAILFESFLIARKAYKSYKVLKQNKKTNKIFDVQITQNDNTTSIIDLPKNKALPTSNILSISCDKKSDIKDFQKCRKKLFTKKVSKSPVVFISKTHCDSEKSEQKDSEKYQKKGLFRSRTLCDFENNDQKDSQKSSKDLQSKPDNLLKYTSKISTKKVVLLSKNPDSSDFSGVLTNKSLRNSQSIFSQPSQRYQNKSGFSKSPQSFTRRKIRQYKSLKLIKSPEKQESPKIRTQQECLQNKNDNILKYCSPKQSTKKVLFSFQNPDDFSGDLTNKSLQNSQQIFSAPLNAPISQSRSAFSKSSQPQGKQSKSLKLIKIRKCQEELAKL